MSLLLLPFHDVEYTDSTLYPSLQRGNMGFECPGIRHSFISTDYDLRYAKEKKYEHFELVNNDSK